jgi:beta-1,4-mannosyl-glycoprotein beta-1,4-N-acetylglucosaminyltransferase
MSKELQNAVYEYVKDTESAVLNYNVAREYHKINQTASAVTYYLRAAERSEDDNDLAYECLLQMGICFETQGKRGHSVRNSYMHAISLCPSRPEAYFLLGKQYEQSKWYNLQYTLIQVALSGLSVKHKPLKSDVGYPGYYALLFNKAVAGWWWGKHVEAEAILRDLHENYWDEMTDEYRLGVQNNFNNLKLPYKYKHVGGQLNLPPNTKTAKIIDVFPYFNEKELMELRINVLKDHVDQFVIIESNQTHSGIPKEYTAMKTIEELNLPKDKILVLEVAYSDSIQIDEIDTLNSQLSQSPKEVLAWSRERIQRDAITSAIENFSDDAVFILSDCDEIINPRNIKYVVDMAKQFKNNVIKVPLTLLEGRADQQVCDANGNPVAWAEGMMICLKDHLRYSTPTKIKSEKLTPYSIVYLTENNNMVTDLGWHFTWMGDEERKKKKAESFIHYANLNVVNNVSSDSLKKLGIESKYGYKTSNYSTTNLPRILFDLPKVKEFLLPEGQP